MNIIDVAVLALFAFFVLSGWYRGFINTLLALCAFVLSCMLAFFMRPLVSNAIKGNAQLYNTALYYAEGAELVGARDDELLERVALAHTNVAELSKEGISAVVEGGRLPIPLASRIAENIAKEAFKSDGLTTLGEYFNQTIVNVFINLISILLLFVAIRLLLAFFIHLVDYARKGFPALQAADGMVGAAFGLVRGFLAMYILFMLAPAALIVLPAVQGYIEESFFGNFFYTSNFLLRLIPGV